MDIAYIFYVVGTIALSLWIVLMIAGLIFLYWLSKQVRRVEQQIHSKIDAYQSTTHKVLPFLGKTGAAVSIVSMAWNVFKQFQRRR